MESLYIISDLHLIWNLDILFKLNFIASSLKRNNMAAPIVVYIIGDSRSGSTLLDYLLSSHPDAVSLGELHHFHGHYYKKGTGKSWNWECSCGKDLQSCEFWSKILKEINFSENFETKLPKVTSGFLSQIIHKIFIKKKLENKKMLQYGKTMAENRWKIYETVAQQTGKNVIIDSSKNADEAYYLDKYKKGDIRFLLLNRDLHQVALSKKNRISSTSSELKAYYGLKEKSIYRSIFNSFGVFRDNNFILNLIEKENRNIVTKKIDYTNLTINTEEEILKVCGFLNLIKFSVPAETNIYHTLPHVLGGSPSRYKRRPIEPDDRWKDYYKDKKFALTFSKLLQKL